MGERRRWIGCWACIAACRRPSRRASRPPPPTCRAPFAVVDLDAFDANAATLVRLAAGMPIRIATKSLRSRPLIERALGRDGFRGLMCYAVREALWWARDGHDDLLVAYPSVDVPALAELAADPALTRAVIVMIDSVEHVDFIAREVPATRACGWRSTSTRRCASARPTWAYAVRRRGPRPTSRPSSVVAQERGLVVAGVMFYDAQIAGLPDASPAVRRVKQALRRRAADPPRRGRRGRPRRRRRWSSSTAAARAACTSPRGDPSVTELAAGSGLFGRTLFDGYDAFRRGRRALRPRRGAPARRRGSRRSRRRLRRVRSAGLVAGARRPLAGRASRCVRARGPARCRRRSTGPGADRLRARRPGMVPARQGGGAGRALRRSSRWSASDGRRAGSSDGAATYRGEGK